MPQDKRVEGLLGLVGAVLRLGAGNPFYFQDPCGVFWATMAGLSPKDLWVTAWKRKGIDPGEYVPKRRCNAR